MLNNIFHTNLKLCDGDILSVGIIANEDNDRRDIHITYTPMSSHIPTVEFALSASAVDILIELLQEKANEVRFINGEKLIDYPKPKLLKIKKSGKDRLNKNR
jgi:hypothetical protein